MSAANVESGKMPERITSRSNPRVRALKSALAQRRGDTVGIEGYHLVREAITSGLQMDTLYVREDQAGVLDNLPFGAAREMLLLSADAFDSAASTENAQGIAAVLQRPHAHYTPAPGKLLLMADGIQDPGNLGALIRSAEAFGAGAVVLGEGTVDPWNGKSLRAAAGAAFRLPLPRFDGALLLHLRSAGVKIIAADAHGGVPAHTAELAGSVLLVVGNEAAGVSQALLQAADLRVTIPTTGPTESLNAAIAGSVLLYEASRQRAAAAKQGTEQ
jgi:RNA methyltransferase, TrmH family